MKYLRVVKDKNSSMQCHAQNLFLKMSKPQGLLSRVGKKLSLYTKF